MADPARKRAALERMQASRAALGPRLGRGGPAVHRDVAPPRTGHERRLAAPADHPTRDSPA